MSSGDDDYGNPDRKPRTTTPNIVEELHVLIKSAHAESGYDPERDMLTDPFCRRVVEAAAKAAAEIERLREELGDCRESLRLEVIDSERLHTRLASADNRNDALVNTLLAVAGFHAGGSTARRMINAALNANHSEIPNGSTAHRTAYPKEDKA